MPEMALQITRGHVYSAQTATARRSAPLLDARGIFLSPRARTQQHPRLLFFAPN